MVFCGCFGPKGAPHISGEPQETFSSNVHLEKGASPAPEPAAAAASAPVVSRPAAPAPEPVAPAPEPVAPLDTPAIASTPPTSPPKVFVQLRPVEDQKPTKAARPPSQPPFDLHALPITWHKRLSVVLGNPDKLALLQVSKAMCQVVQAVHSVTVRASVPMAANEATAAEALLKKACQNWAHVTLECTSTGQPAQAAAATCSLLSEVVAALDRPLSAIKCVDLTGLELDALVPAWLTTACPDMSSLRLSNCQFNLSTTSTAAASACPQLKELHLSDPPTFLEDDEVSPSSFTTSPTHSAMWQRQLCALTGLKSLSVGHFASRFLGCLATVLPSTLERLCFDDNAVPWFLAAWFPSLKELELPSTVVDDRAMKVLVSLKQLQSVACRGFDLEADYSERPCAWTRLRLEHVSELDVAMLARLPLDNIKSFEIEYEAECTILPSAELDENRRVAAAVAKGDDSGRAGKHIAGSVTLQNSSRGADTPCIAAIMPILARCQCESLVIAHVTPVTPELLGAMSHYLASKMISRMRFWECTWDEEAIPLLLPSLPRAVSRVHLQRSTSRTMRMQKSMSMAVGRGFSEAGLISQKPFLRSQMSERGIKSVSSEIRRMTSEELTESDLAKVCASARRPVELDVYLGKGSGWEEGWEQRVGAAMAAAGHQYVELPSN